MENKNVNGLKKELEKLILMKNRSVSLFNQQTFFVLD